MVKILRRKAKKGIEISLNTIIIAAIAIIVLIVLSIIFTSNIKKTNDSLSDCAGKGGYVCDSKETCMSNGGAPVGTIDSNSICCIELKKGALENICTKP